MKLRDVTLAVFVMMVWGFNFVAAKWGVGEVPPIFLIGLRFTLVAALLLPFVRVPRGHFGKIFLLSVTFGTLHFSLMFTGLTRMDAGTASIITQTQVPFGAVLAAIFYRDMFGWRRAAGLVAAMAGVTVLAGDPRVEQDLVAVVLVVLAALFWALANVQMKELGPVDGFSLNAYLGLFSAPMLFASSYVLEEGQWAALRAADLKLLWSLLYMAIAVTIVSHTLWYRLLRRFTVNQAMPFMLLVPVFAVLFGVVVLDEPFGWRVALGGLLTVSGVAAIIALPKK